MKFWFTIVVGTVVCSAGYTWLSMNHGQQIAVKAGGEFEESKEPPKLVFDNVKNIGNYVEIKTGDSPLDEQKHFEIRFRNEGSGPLKWELLDVSCGCSDVQMDGERMVAKKVFRKAPGETGVLRLSWKTGEKHLRDGPELLLKYTFDVNEPMFVSAFKVEILTKAVPAPAKTN
jgi:hypothetical protein